jgi:hypothetical protein
MLRSSKPKLLIWQGHSCSVHCSQQLFRAQIVSAARRGDALETNTFIRERIADGNVLGALVAQQCCESKEDVYAQKK